MPHDARREEAEDWFVRARLDLRAARVDLDVTPPLLADAAFHCQQAVEKALKGLLACRDEPFAKTHDLRELGLACLRYDPSLETLVRRAAPLTEYAWRFRYPGPVVDPARADVESALAVARDVVRAVEDIVSDGC